jgi:DNA processing protein
MIGAVTAKILVSYCGSAESVFRASRRELLKIPGIGEIMVKNITESNPESLAAAEVTFVEKHRIEALFYTDERYPARLKQCYDCPALLFFKGSDTGLLAAPRIVGIVGTRQPTREGKALCEEIIEELKPYNVLIVSGLAYGVDGTAHQKATAADIPNIGVLGHGLSTIYPADHRGLAQKMIENGGLLTEFTSETKPDRENFPMRNRIIAGLCDALLVVESGTSGGSMITAELANQYGRDLFAVPGRVRDTKSAGCNLLIKSDRAHLTESADDIAKTMNWSISGKPRPVQAQLFLELNPTEKSIAELVQKNPEIAIDQLSLAAQLPPGELAAHILALEFKGVIRTLPGKRYSIV